MAFVLMLACIPSARGAEPKSSGEILSDLHAVRNMGSVLYVAAHPDDENTRLITWLARGLHVRTAYLSVTRGDGGQNVLGPEFGEQLGLIRTHELLEARKIDGGRQFFTRAIDFGFSKSSSETLRIWDREKVLGDVVFIIRSFRPDVIATRFSPVPGGTHGHHTASAILALEAFNLAGNPDAYPEQLKLVKPWQPKRIFMNRGGRGGGEAPANAVRMEVGTVDELTSTSIGLISAMSRGKHMSQGFEFTGGGGGGNRGGGTESFQLLAGEPATNGIFDGVDTTWGRVEGGAEIGRMLDDVIAKFDKDNPAASVPALFAIKKRMTPLADDPLVLEKRDDLDRIIADALGVSVVTTASQPEVSPGGALELTHTVNTKSDVFWLAVRYPDKTDLFTHKEVKPGQPQTAGEKRTLPADMPLTQPYWLREPAEIGTYHVDDLDLIDEPINPPAYPVQYMFAVGEESFNISTEPQYVYGDRPRTLVFVSPVSLNVIDEVEIFKPGVAEMVDIEAMSGRTQSSETAGTSPTRNRIFQRVALKPVEGWSVDPSSQPYQIAGGTTRTLAFNITPPDENRTATIGVTVGVGGKTYSNERIEIDYPHIPHLLLQPPANIKAVALDLQTRGKRIGYVPGAGDSVAEAIKQMGYEVTSIESGAITEETLRGLDAVVVGIRAFDVRDDLAGKLPVLMKYVENGGNLIFQYNREDGFRGDGIAPLRLSISRDRVTDENAEMTFLAPEHPVLNTPNKITQADFEGWVQERGVYYPREWSEQFTPILAASDPGEEPLRGGLLVAQHGKGYVVYTGLAFFRQLPAGVPGAYRLFANMISLGRP